MAVAFLALALDLNGRIHYCLVFALDGLVMAASSATCDYRAKYAAIEVSSKAGPAFGTPIVWHSQDDKLQTGIRDSSGLAEDVNYGRI